MTTYRTTSYSANGFWDKVSNCAKSAGKAVLGNALKIYYVAQDKDTPLWAKTTIYSALAYFICPIDAVPDITPFIGYSDDAAVLVSAIAAVAAHIKDEHVVHADETLKRWFG